MNKGQEFPKAVKFRRVKTSNGVRKPVWLCTISVCGEYMEPSEILCFGISRVSPKKDYYNKFKGKGIAYMRAKEMAGKWTGDNLTYFSGRLPRQGFVERRHLQELIKVFNNEEFDYNEWRKEYKNWEQKA